ncbi:MAG: rhomboid family intramembrane serine protease [Candidatus Cloacimonetes bacterium]|nr:rhomboid family intramembrane serine protease [Candidatus Cloacimonadota bacterium]
MRIKYNAPVVLTFTFISIAVMALSHFTNGIYTRAFFVVGGQMNFSDPLDYFRMISNIFGHANWAHLIGNFSLILLIGPLLEEKYGSWSLGQMIFATAIFTSILNIALLDTGAYGASGIVFMMILLGSLSNFKDGEIPLTFLLIAVLYVGEEVVNSLKPDNVSQFAHILGGFCGACFGFFLKSEK